MSRVRVDHIAIAVHNLQESLAFYRDQFGLECIEIETVEEQGVTVAKLDLGNVHIELLEPIKADTPVGKFLQQRGPGLHHICVGVNSIKDELANLKNHGTKLIDQEPKMGASGAQIAFVHPKSTGGVLIELSQPKKRPGQTNTRMEALPAPEKP
jgi:methylmalonyl-CoA/ethylmalonyl-CoA epimerase